MRVERLTVTIGDVVDGYEDKGDDGVVGYGGRLDIRPPFQREFVYDDDRRAAVVDSVLRGFPLNAMYWVADGNGRYAVLDGQQRTISLCTYHAGLYSVPVDGHAMGFDNLTVERRETFLGYPLHVYACRDCTEGEVLDWFRVINIGGVQLNNQELLNAVYVGPWVMDAKRRFSKRNCPAVLLGKNYMSGTATRQDYLATTLKWIGGDIEKYMALHQHDANADREWQYFQAVIGWVQRLFPTYRREMRGLPWGELYNKCRNMDFTATDLEARVSALMMDDDVGSKKGVYEYVLTGDERCLNIRTFSESMRRAAYERQKGICVKCGKHFTLEDMEGDHITPWSKGGPTTADNCQMLCKQCNRTKSDH